MKNKKLKPIIDFYDKNITIVDGCIFASNCLPKNKDLKLLAEAFSAIRKTLKNFGESI